MKKPILARFSAGILVAATGVGAGDLVLSALSGARYGVALLWAIVLGAVLKYFLNEGLAKWEVATGTTLLQGWVEKLPRFVSIYFGVYLVFWAFLVASTLIVYNGLVANTIIPLPLSDRWGTTIWGGVQSAVVVGVIRWGGFKPVATIMKVLIGLMFVVVLISACLVTPEAAALLEGLFIPQMSLDLKTVLFVFALVGGVGGTLTILCYSYWLREQREQGAVPIREVRYDLGLAYFLTAIFGIAVTIIAAGVQPDSVKGYGLVLSMAERLGSVLGNFGYWSFLLGFWSAVFTSMVGVWNGVPYLFADFLQRYRRRYYGKDEVTTELNTSNPYQWFLLYLAFPPILLTLFEKPNWIGVAYALSGAFFMPFLAALLLYFNNRIDWVGKLKNSWPTNLVLLFCLFVFGLLFWVQLRKLG
ncbi:MAG: Nramp family divalent metal transporter [Bacteroidota bacterium]